MKYQIPLSIQWHITTDCGNRCSHCYMFDSATYDDERKNTLPLAGLLKIVDSLQKFEKKYHSRFVNFYITGGDPLLREDWPYLVSALRREDRTVCMMCNPETLDEKNIEKMLSLGIRRVQMSLDGLEEKHDDCRSVGSFRHTVEKIDLLARNGMQCYIMFTLFPENQDDLLPLLNYVAKETQAFSFCFDIGCFVGNADGLDRGPGFDLRKILSGYLAEKEKLRKEGCRTRISEKSHFIRLLRYENETFYPVMPENDTIFSGCAAGWGGVVLLADGTALACRRLPLAAGKMPEQSFEDIFLGSDLFRKMRRAASFAECGACRLYSVCRGCPASAYGLTGNCFEKHPLCFRNDIDRETAGNAADNSLPMEVSFDEEWNLIRASRGFRQHVFNTAEKDKGFGSVFLDLKQNEESRRGFLFDPYAYLDSRKTTVSSEQIAFLVEIFSGYDSSFGKTPDGLSLPDVLEARITANMLNSIF